MECIEALGEHRGSEDPDGLTAVLQEAGSCTLHSRADDRLRGRLGDTGPDWIVPADRVGIVHPTHTCEDFTSWWPIQLRLYSGSQIAVPLFGIPDVKAIGTSGEGWPIFHEAFHYRNIESPAVAAGDHWSS